MTFQIFEFPLEDYIAFSIEDKPLSLLLNTMGFESQIWVMNLKNGFVFICYQAALFIFIVITKPIFKQLDRKFDYEEIQRQNELEANI